MAQTESKSCDKLNSFRIVTIIKNNLGESQMKLSIFSLKTETLLESPRLGSKLFHSIIAGGKKCFLKKLCLVLIRGILPTVLVAYCVLLT